jgi:hypothetical protein
MAEEISFQGFGSITKPKTAFAEGFGIDGSYAPSWTTEPKLRQNSNSNPRQYFYPFQVIRKYISNQLSYGVVYYSELRSNFIDSGSTVSISGLLSQEYPADDDAGWVNANPGDSAYLEVEISSGTISTATIKIDGNYAGGIGVSGGDIEFDSPTPPQLQTYARKLIAEINSDGTVRQYLYTNLGMINLCVNGVPCLVPILQ